MRNADKFYINGEWVTPSTDTTLDVINPATEKSIAKIAMGGKADVDSAVAAAKAAFETFSKTSVEERAELLGRIIDAYKARMGEIAETVSKEMGAPTGLANAAQAPAGLGHLIFAKKALENYSFVEDVGTSRVVREPIGVCGLITPWNWRDRLSL
ncbi:MAG: aldehyde dehydrogenase family protein [Pseudomonadota bacterium]